MVQKPFIICDNLVKIYQVAELEVVALQGLDLVVEPGPASGPINFLAYPVLEISGKTAKVQVEFSFNRKVSSN